MTTAAQEVVSPVGRTVARSTAIPTKKTRKKAPSTLDRLKPVLVSAYFWYVLLAVVGAVVFSAGVAIVGGFGHGCIAFGALTLLGSEVIRGGMIRG